jgi:hypothetical protein
MLLPWAAMAQVPSPGSGSQDRVVYPASFYESFAPRTALDMIDQTPGFVLDATEDDDEERRGFAGAVGNVLVDGQRLSAKSQSVRDVLARIAAREVLRVEVLRGSAVAGDASGASVLANVVRAPTAGGGTWESGFEVTNEHELMPNGKFGWSGRRETVEYSVGANAFTHDHRNEGRFDIRDGAGALAARRRDRIPHQNGEYALNGQVALPAGDGRLTVTGQIAFQRHDERFDRITLAPDGTRLGEELIPFFDRIRSAEAGATWQRPVGDWDMNLTLLATRRHQHWRVSSTLFDDQDVVQQQLLQQVSRRSGESILRGTLARNADSGRFEVGAEAAVNTLDGQQRLVVDLGGGPVPVDLVNANLRVEETRAEAFASHAWRISPLWSLDSRVAAETSRLAFSGDTEQSVSLTYLKPRVQLTRQFGAHQVQLRVFRDVGQLDFNDFVTTAAFADDIIEGGNPDLRPQTAWATEIEADLRFPRETALRLRGFRHAVDDVVDFVPVGPPGGQFDAPGNIGAGSILGAELSLRVPLQPLVRGGTLNVTALWQESAVRDPLTGVRRQFSGLAENEIDAQFRQDLNAWRFAWGASYVALSTIPDYRLGELNRFDQLHRLDVFLESTAIAGLKLRLAMQSALSGAEYRDRRLYTPDRAGGLLRREQGRYFPGHWWLFTVSSSF